MHTVTIPEAMQSLPSLLREAQAGSEVWITDNQTVIARIMPPVEQPMATPRFGSAKGLIEVPDDFDAPLECFKEYMP